MFLDNSIYNREYFKLILVVEVFLIAFLVFVCFLSNEDFDSPFFFSKSSDFKY